VDIMVEETWRKALRERGREWVQAELRRRPGRPEDTLYDVVFEEPFPTRQFCLNWCAEQDNRLLHFSGTTIAAIGVFVLLAVCTFKAFQATNERAALQPQLHPSIAASRHMPPRQSSDFSGNSQAQGPSSNAASAAGTTPPDICQYISYDTDRCRVQGPSQYPLPRKNP
jgi:hypothetical protein